jgi:hypothetical protein
VGMDEVQAARTESLFREVNERIAEAVEDGPLDDAQFLCECSDSSCTHAIEMPLNHYEEVRSEPAQFIVKLGHADPEIERVVDAARGYAVVEKDHPDAAEVAKELDPRP